MAKFWLCAAVGFYLLQLCLAQIGLNISCRYAGVFHVEKNRRYSLTRDEAVELCKALNSTIPTWEQMEKAYTLGLETCRYGYIEDKIVLPRHTPYHLCAANNTGIYILTSNISDRYDTFCFNASEKADVNCDPVIKLYSVWPNNESKIEIFNSDGSRFIDGKRFTERPPVTDDDISMGSGSANDRVTTDPSVIRHGISQNPHSTDDVISTSHVDEDNEDSTNFPWGPYDHHPGNQHPESTTGEASSNGKLHENSTQQGQEVPEDFPLWWPTEEHKGVQNTASRKDESSEENDDDDGGDDDDDDDNDNEEGSGHIIPETVIEWNNSGDMEPQPSNTTVVSSGDVKYEDSTHDSLLQGVPSGRDSEVKYSRNGTREDVPPGIVPLGDDEHNSTATAVSSSGDFFKQEDSHQHSQDGAHPGFETEDIVPTTTTTSNVLHPGLVPSIEREGPLREELFHHTVVSFNESAEHEESHQDQLSAEGISGPGSGQSSATNRTIHDVLEILTLPSKSGHENESSQTALTFHDGSKHEDTSHDSQTPVDHPRSDTEDSYPTNKTSDDVLHSFVSSSENESGSSHKHINMESNDGMKHEESTQNPVPHGVYPEWASEERYPTNTSSKEILPGIVPQSEHEHKNDSIYTVVPSDFTHYEDSTHDTIHTEWDSEKKYLTNTSGDHLLPGIFHPAENEHEKEPSHTAIASSDNGKHEDATKEPVLHGRHPGWDSEDDHPRNTTRDDVQPGIIPPRERHQEMPDTAVASNGDNNYEDSTQDPLNQETHPGWNDEHRHPENASKDELVPVIIPPSENVNEKETSHISPVVIHNDHEDSTQQPLPPHQPGWYTEEKYPTTTSRDDALIGDNENEHDPLSKDVVYDGSKEDSTPEPVRQWGGEDKYTTKSTADALFPGIVPRRGINQNNKTDHTAVVSSDGAKNEESTQDPQLHSLHPGWSNEDEHLVNNTQDYIIPGVSPEIDSGFERHPTSSTASPDPDKHGRKVSHTGMEDVSPLPGETPKSQPRRAHIPDWLIVVASLLALSLILGVCIAVNSRRRCGQKKKLVINNGKGGIDQKNMGGLNGEASKSQEMLHLVHNEKPEDQTSPHDEFLAIDETQKQQDMALKSGM